MSHLRSTQCLLSALLFSFSLSQAVGAESILLNEVEALPVDIRYVKTCGQWTAEGQHGYQRIVVGDVFGGVGSELYLQWMVQASQERKAEVFKTLSVKELNNDHSQYYFETVDCVSAQGRSLVKITAAYEHDENDEIHHVTVELLGVGQYKLTDRVTRPLKKR